MLRVPKKKPLMGRLVEPELTASQREDLKREFDQIFHSDRPERREQFLNVVDLLLNEYRASIEPSTDYLLGGRLDELLRHAEPFAEAVEQFNEDEINLIQQEFLIAARANGVSYPLAKEEAANAVVALIEAASAARYAAKIADQLRARTPVREPGAEIFIALIAQEYSRVFGRRPSPAKNGVFWKAQEAICRIAQVKPHLSSGPNEVASFGETALRSILQRNGLIGEPLPRGRKARAK